MEKIIDILTKFKYLLIKIQFFTKYLLYKIEGNMFRTKNIVKVFFTQ